MFRARGSWVTGTAFASSPSRRAANGVSTSTTQSRGNAEVLYIEDDSVRHTVSEFVRWNCVNVYRLPCGQRFSLGLHGIRFIAALLQVVPAMITEMYQGRDQRILQHGRRVQRGLIAQIKQLLKAVQMKCW